MAKLLARVQREYAKAMHITQNIEYALRMVCD
jgi:hypothetical protein